MIGVPGAPNSAGSADLTMSMFGVWVAVTTAVSAAVTSGPVGGVPVTVPVLVMLPASRSAWVVV